MKISVNKVGVVAALLHIAILTVLLAGATGNSRIWLFMIFFVIDFPVSLISTAGLDIMITEWGEPLYFNTELKTMIYNYWPTGIHLVLGTIWWYFIPVLIDKLFKFLGKQQNKDSQ